MIGPARGPACVAALRVTTHARAARPRTAPPRTTRPTATRPGSPTGSARGPLRPARARTGLLWGVGEVTARKLRGPALVSLLGPAAGRQLHALGRDPRPDRAVPGYPGTAREA